MSITFERLRLVAAVLICVGLLVFSNYAQRGWTAFLAEPTPAQDVADVHAALAILGKAKFPISGIQPCDAIKAFMPDKFSRADGDLRMTDPSKRDVILCFKGDIDYGDALKAALTRRLFWQRGVGGDRIVVFASSEARFMQVARDNGLTFAPGDLKDMSLYLDRLAPHARSQRYENSWMIDPSATEDEALFGPYVDLNPGVYRLGLVFEPPPGIGCRDFSGRLKVAVAATSAARKNILALRRELVLTNTAAGGCRLEGGMRFTVPAGSGQGVETPIWVQSSVRARLVGYDLFPEN